jgi:hypothetical protein
VRPWKPQAQITEEDRARMEAEAQAQAEAEARAREEAAAAAQAEAEEVLALIAAERAAAAARQAAIEAEEARRFHEALKKPDPEHRHSRPGCRRAVRPTETRGQSKRPSTIATRRDRTP